MALTRTLLESLLGLDTDKYSLPDSHVFLCPDHPGPHPAILYCHAHGGDYEAGRGELLDGSRWLYAPYADDLLRAGFAVLCIDMPCFGARQGEGSEAAAVKTALWQGQPLFGQMVGEQLAGVDYLVAHPAVDASRIATLGLSMGAALAFWTAALDQRIAACAQLCMLAEMRALIASGDHDRHGHYLTVPGLLRHGDMGDVAALIAPRPQLICHGACDPLTPASARDAALARVHDAYRGSDTLQTFCDTESAHAESRAMREAVMRFLTHQLADEAA